MEPVIMQLDSRYETAFCSLVEEYLPDCKIEKLIQYYQMFPKTFLVLIYGEDVAGVAFGWPRKLEVSEDDSFMLNGIAIRCEYQGKGYGKLLLHTFEQTAKEYDARAISLGSAQGYVEKFYIECGYTPVEYKYWGESGSIVEKEYENIAEYYSYIRKNEDGFVVMYKEL